MPQYPPRSNSRTKLTAAPSTPGLIGYQVCDLRDCYPMLKFMSPSTNAGLCEAQSKHGATKEVPAAVAVEWPAYFAANLTVDPVQCYDVGVYM